MNKNELSDYCSGMLNSLYKITQLIEDAQLGHTFEYSEEDAMDAMRIFFHVISNINIHETIRKKLSLKEGKCKSELLGKEMRTFMIKMTGIDPYHYIREKNAECS